MQTDNITLYYRQGSSDKVYQTAIEPKGDGFVVNFAFGRRGTTLQTGTKTAKPVELAAAKKIFDKLVSEKTAKGYTPGEDGKRYQQTDKADRATGLAPQLLNSIDQQEAEKLIEDSNWWAQEKFDGRRVMIRRAGDAVTGVNRQGLIIALPEPIEKSAAKLAGERWLMDGEAVGEILHVFDLLESGDKDLRAEPYSHRLGALREHFGEESTKASKTPKPRSVQSIRVVETATTPADKRAMLKSLTQSNREGIVFKRHDAQSIAGRPASGGSQVKFKFTATASCIVAGVHSSRRSVSLELCEDNKRVSVGSVTIPPSHDIPAAGQIVEVRYLYAYAGGSLYQPVYLGVRDDIDIDTCTIAQLKLKPSDGDRDVE